ncbi:MAG: PQQ-binding-like beta-propeller repeat protein [Actinomycetota bacterium]
MRALAISLFLLTAPVAAHTASTKVWPGFRGDGNSRTSAQNLPLRWSDTENVAWQMELPGYGQSSPVIWNDRVFVTSVAGEMQDRLLVRCLSLADGRSLWNKELKGSQGVKTSDYVSKAAPTPAVDADRLYVFFESGDLLALTHGGAPVWQRSLVREYGAIRSNHGLGSSPVLSEAGLLLQVVHDGGAYLLCVDPKTGQNRWKRDHPFGAGWATPAVAKHQGRSVVLATSSGRVDALDLTTGAPLWHVTGLKGNTVPSPSLADGVAVIGSSDPNSTVALRLGGEGDVTASHINWRQPDVNCSFGSPLVYQGCVYFVNKAGVAYCLDLATGKPNWDTRLAASSWASPIAAGDRIYFFDTTGGALVTKAGPKLEKLAENRFPITGRVYGVAAVDGVLVFRTGNRIVRLGK